MAQPIITKEMVEAKEKENADRLKELTKRSRSIAREVEPEPNFPPECCCIKPMIYHNIREQVPVPHQRFVYILCGLYLTLMVLIVYNIVAALVCFIFGGSALHFGLSLLYLLGLPGGWVLWYYNVYVATTQGSRPSQVLALFGLFLAVCFDAWMAVGVPGLGGCGWIITIANTGSVLHFVLLLVAAVLWTLHGLVMLVMMIRYWKVSSDLIKCGKYIYRQTIA